MQKKRKVAIVIILTGAVLGIILSIKNDGIIEEGDKVARNDYGKGSSSVEFQVSGGGYTSDYTYEIEERRYSKDEVEVMLPQFLGELENYILADNVSAEEIYGNLLFPDRIEGYPFEIFYEMTPEDIYDRNGMRKKEVTDREIMQIDITASYNGNEYHHQFHVVILPEEKSASEKWLDKLDKEMDKAQQGSSTEPYFYLPQEVDGEKLEWTQSQMNKGLMVFLFSFLVGMTLFFGDYFQKKEKEKKRKEEIREAYPAFAIRYAMLVSAGMTLKQAMNKIADSQLPQKGALYQEILRSIHEMEAGVPERTVYENLGFRCNVIQMRKFGILLSSKLRIGQEGLGELLREEAFRALAEHREEIRKKGETAGTKLLFPMFLLLLIVFIVIMVPALSSFTF